MYCEQVDAESFAALCLEPYSRIRVLAGYSSPGGQDTEATAAAGGIATIDLGTKKVVSKVCQRPNHHLKGALSTSFGSVYSRSSTCRGTPCRCPSQQQAASASNHRVEASAGGGL